MKLGSLLLMSGLALGQAMPNLQLHIPNAVGLGWGVSLHGNFNMMGGYSAGDVLDVSALPGVDCTGATDSSTALNRAFDSRRGGNINGKLVLVPMACNLRVDHQVIVFGQSNFVIDGGGRPGGGLFGCNGSSGAVLLVNRSGHGELRGLNIYAKGASCTSKFTRSILVSNANTGSGVTTTDLKFVDMALHTGGGSVQIPNYVGIQWGINGEVNNEDMRLIDSSVSCSNSTNSYGIDIEGGNSDDNEGYHNIINGCFQGVRIFAGGGRFTNNKFGGNGAFSVFGTGGGTFWVRGCAVPLDIIGNEAAEGSGQFINSNNDQGGFGCQMFIAGNQWTSPDIAMNVYPVNLNPGGADAQVVVGNSFNANGTTSMPIIGSDHRSPSGPLGSLVEFGNEVLHDTYGLLGSTPFRAGMFSMASGFPHTLPKTPSTSSDTCVAGAMWNDANYIYVCTSTNTIKRAALTKF